jgi:hypothetical protein
MPLPQSGAKYIIWGKVVASPESESCWILWVRGCPWLVLAPKVLQPSANQLACWFCASLLDWVSCLTLVLIPSRSSNTPLYPPFKVLKAGTVPQIPNLSVVSIFRFNLNLPRDLGAHQQAFCIYFTTSFFSKMNGMFFSILFMAWVNI